MGRNRQRPTAKASAPSFSDMLNARMYTTLTSTATAGLSNVLDPTELPLTGMGVSGIGFSMDTTLIPLPVVVGTTVETRYMLAWLYYSSAGLASHTPASSLRAFTGLMLNMTSGTATTLGQMIAHYKRIGFLLSRHTITYDGLVDWVNDARALAAAAGAQPASGAAPTPLLPQMEQPTADDLAVERGLLVALHECYPAEVRSVLPVDERIDADDTVDGVGDSHADTMHHELARLIEAGSVGRLRQYLRGSPLHCVSARAYVALNGLGAPLLPPPAAAHAPRGSVSSTQYLDETWVLALTQGQIAMFERINETVAMRLLCLAVLADAKSSDSADHYGNYMRARVKACVGASRTAEDNEATVATLGFPSFEFSRCMQQTEHVGAYPRKYCGQVLNSARPNSCRLITTNHLVLHTVKLLAFTEMTALAVVRTVILSQNPNLLMEPPLRDAAIRLSTGLRILGARQYADGTGGETFPYAAYFRLPGAEYCSWRSVGILGEIALRVRCMQEPRWVNVLNRVYPETEAGNARHTPQLTEYIAAKVSMLCTSLPRQPATTIDANQAIARVGAEMAQGGGAVESSDEDAVTA